jgi:hypothetical protein
MCAGKLLVMDTPSKLKAALITGDVWEVHADSLQDGLTTMSEMNGVLRVGRAGNHLRIITEKEKKKVDLLKRLREKRVNVKEIIAREQPLEDVFISLTR